jgi:Mrp family chromosome partitioning ATPase
MSDTGSAEGRIVTFYSYKGGTGRSMAMANVSWLLALSGFKVLMIDWDLEAPGLHRYFRPFLEDADLAESDGLIDFAIHFAEAASAQTGDQTDGTKLTRICCPMLNG